jgi:hypothetical protein
MMMVSHFIRGAFSVDKINKMGKHTIEAVVFSVTNGIGIESQTRERLLHYDDYNDLTQKINDFYSTPLPPPTSQFSSLQGQSKASVRWADEVGDNLLHYSNRRRPSKTKIRRKISQISTIPFPYQFSTKDDELTQSPFARIHIKMLKRVNQYFHRRSTIFSPFSRSIRRRH